MKEKVIISWSGGKDSALALDWVLGSGRYEPVALLTTMDRDSRRVLMHDIPISLVRCQAEALGLPLCPVPLPARPSNRVYETAIAAALKPFQEEGANTLVFGDIFLEDVRQYRQNQLAALNSFALFPLWGRATDSLLRSFVHKGYKAVLNCVDPKAGAAELLGRYLDSRFCDSPSPGLDPCGERGEFHSFVFQGPIFSHDIAFNTGNNYQKQDFLYLDLSLPG